MTSRRARDNFPKNRCMGTKMTDKAEPYYAWINYEDTDEIVYNTVCMIQKYGFSRRASASSASSRPTATSS